MNLKELASKLSNQIVSETNAMTAKAGGMIDGIALLVQEWEKETAPKEKESATLEAEVVS